jgi:exopolysaccharide production protein ExoQ
MRSDAPAVLPIVIGAAIVAVLVAMAGVREPAAFLLLPAAVAVAAVAYAAHRWPDRTVALVIALILVADTKFRFRDSSASLRGEIDGQVMLELALYGLTGLVIVVVSIRKSARLAPGTVMEGLLFVSGLVAMLSTAWSSAPVLTLVRSTQLMVVYALARTLLFALGPRRTYSVIGDAVLLYVVVCSTVAIALPSTVLTYDDLDSINRFSDSINRFSWFGVWPTQAARFVALAALLLVADYLFVPSQSRRRKFGLPGWIWVGPLGVLLVLTYSRTALVAFAVAVGAMLAVRHLRIWRAAALVAVAAGLALAFVNSGETLLDLLRRGSESSNPLATILFRGQTAEQVSSLSNRVTLWQGVWKLFLDHPFLGYGYQGSRAYLLALLPWAGHAHNALAQASLDLGIAGTVPVCVGLARCLSPRLLRAGGPASPVVGWRATVFALGVFLLIVSASAESFVEPGFEALVFALCVLARERVPLEMAAVNAARPRRVRTVNYGPPAGARPRVPHGA